MVKCGNVISALLTTWPRGPPLIFFIFFAQNIDCEYSLEQPCQGCSNEYPQFMFWIKNKKKGTPLLTPVFLFKLENMFHGHVFLMSIFAKQFERFL